MDCDAAYVSEYLILRPPLHGFRAVPRISLLPLIEMLSYKRGIALQLILQDNDKLPCGDFLFSGNINPRLSREAGFYLERVEGVEPSSRPWQGRIIAAIRYPPAPRGLRRARPANSPSDRRLCENGSHQTL